LLELDNQLIHYDIKELAICLTRIEENTVINIIDFARQYIEVLIVRGGKGTIYPLLTFTNGLCNCFWQSESKDK
jgi:gamma-glutamyl phosphate reductase